MITASGGPALLAVIPSMAGLLQAVAADWPPAEQREALLSRIDRIGKGRYAQRLAAHVENMNLRAEICGLLGTSDDVELSRNDLLSVSGCGSLLALLDYLRRSIEGLPLLPTGGQNEEWRGRRGDGPVRAKQARRLARPVARSPSRSVMRLVMMCWMPWSCEWRRRA